MEPSNSKFLNVLEQLEEEDDEALFDNTSSNLLKIGNTESKDADIKVPFKNNTNNSYLETDKIIPKRNNVSFNTFLSSSLVTQNLSQNIPNASSTTLNFPLPQNTTTTNKNEFSLNEDIKEHYLNNFNYDKNSFTNIYDSNDIKLKSNFNSSITNISSNTTEKKTNLDLAKFDKDIEEFQDRTITEIDSSNNFEKETKAKTVKPKIKFKSLQTNISNEQDDSTPFNIFATMFPDKDIVSSTPLKAQAEELKKIKKKSVQSTSSSPFSFLKELPAPKGSIKYKRNSFSSTSQSLENSQNFFKPLINNNIDSNISLSSSFTVNTNKSKINTISENTLDSLSSSKTLTSSNDHEANQDNNHNSSIYYDKLHPTSTESIKTQNTNSNKLENSISNLLSGYSSDEDEKSQERLSFKSKIQSSECINSHSKLISISSTNESFNSSSSLFHLHTETQVPSDINQNQLLLDEYTFDQNIYEQEKDFYKPIQNFYTQEQNLNTSVQNNYTQGQGAYIPSQNVYTYGQGVYTPTQILYTQGQNTYTSYQDLHSQNYYENTLLNSNSIVEDDIHKVDQDRQQIGLPNFNFTNDSSDINKKKHPRGREWDALNDANTNISDISANSLKDPDWFMNSKVNTPSYFKNNKYTMSTKIWSIPDSSAVSIDEPKRLQRRKHQINWLAKEAVEREGEISDIVSRARQHKYDSRLKYGW